MWNVSTIWAALKQVMQDKHAKSNLGQPRQKEQ
jgi:hypothetical protein